MSVSRDGAGRHIVDFGQNLPGWLRIGVRRPARSPVRVRHGEMLAADGSLYTDNLRTARQTDEFITPGGPRSSSPASLSMASATPRSPAIPATWTRPMSGPGGPL